MTMITTACETKAISIEVVIPCFLVNNISYLWPMYVRCIRDHLFITFACQNYEYYFHIVHNEIINCSWYCFFVIFKSNQLPYKLILWQENDSSFQIQNLHTVRSCPHTPEKSGNVLFRHENRASPKSVGDCCFLKFLRRGLNEKHLTMLSVESSNYKPFGKRLNCVRFQRIDNFPVKKLL